MNTTQVCPICGKPVVPGAPQGLCPECLMKSGFETGGGNQPGEGKSDFVPPAIEEMARLFPQFEIIELLGRGGMGAVYKARQPRLNRFVALKILSPEKQNDPQFAERFEREARALASLTHPNIVTVYDFGELQGHFYLLMEFVDGLTLRQLLQTQKFSPAEALGIVPKICEALQFAHEQGVIHRDIKPENILLDKKGRVKIADFGIAKIMDLGPGDLSLTGAKDVVGTPHYMAPEQIEKPQSVDNRADIFSLGVVFYEMLTGELPLGKFAPPSKKVQIDVRLDEVILRALEKEPARRYQQASVLKTDVETIAGSAKVNEPVAKSQMARILEILFNITFTSPLAIRFANFSALGFLGSLGFLGFLSPPKLRICFGFFSLFGFFGLTGLAFMEELGARHRRNQATGSRQQTSAAKSEMGSPQQLPVVPVLRWRDRWVWDGCNVIALIFVPFAVTVILFAVLFPWFGTYALFALLVEVFGLLFAAVNGWVGYRIRGLKATSPQSNAEVAEALIFRRPLQTPGLAVLHADRLELLGIKGEPITVPLANISSISEVRWFNGSRLWFKRGFVIDLTDGERIGVAVPEPFGRRWRARLSRGSLPELPVDSIGTTKSEIRPHLSIAAVVGACWALPALFFAVLAALAFAGFGGIQLDDVGRITEVLAILFLIVAFSGPFGTTTLGWIALGQIRRSAGKLSGFGLALADGLLFPLLALDGFILYLGALVAEGFEKFQIDLNHPLLAISLAIAAVLDFGIVRRLWQILNQPPTSPIDRLAAFRRFTVISLALITVVTVGLFVLQDFIHRHPSDATVNGIATTDITVAPNGLVVRSLSNELWEAHVTFHNQGSNVCPAFLLLFYAGPPHEGGRLISKNIAGPILPGGIFCESTGPFVLRTSETEIFAVIDPTNTLERPAGSGEWILKTPAAVGFSNHTTFGLVVERSVSGGGDTNRRFIDFDTGKLFAAAESFGDTVEPSPEETRAWWRKTGIDAIGDMNPAVRGLIGFDMAAVPVPKKEWSHATPARLNYYLTLAKAGTPITMSGKGALPATFVIQTREGGRGLLQITGFTNRPPSVIIRYKLVTPAGRMANAAANPLVERKINKLISEFPERRDLSTPESACAAWQRVSAREDTQAICDLSLRPLNPESEKNWYRREAARDPQGLAIYLKALAESKILVVQTYSNELANVITYLPFPKGKGRDPYSARGFGRVNGQWKNLGEDRLPNLKAAKADFRKKKEHLWQQFVELKARNLELAMATGEQAELMKLVEDFFQHNFRDVTARKSLEWGKIQTNPDGSRSIRYKYEAKIWDRDTIIANQEFTFDARGKFLKYTNIAGFPRPQDPMRHGY